MLRFLAPPPDAPPLPQEEIRSTYHYWRLRLLYSTFIGYAIYYFVRLNLSTALPLMEKELGISKTQLGLFVSAHGVIYGVSKFLNGIAADRMNPRVLMTAGLLLSALANLSFGLGSTAIFLGWCWVLNGWFQGMGFPACARTLSYWFAPKERGTKWGIWNTSHQVGGFGIYFLAGLLGTYLGWRYIFLVPGGLALLVSLFVWNRLRDTPASLGLPPVEDFYEAEVASNGSGAIGAKAVARPEPAPEGPQPIGSRPQAESDSSLMSLLVNRVFSNPYIWLACLANFFVYVLRYGFLTWGPSYLNEVKHMPLWMAAAMTGIFEIAGAVGALVAGWLTQRFFANRRAPVAVLYMLSTAVWIGIFWRIPGEFPGLILLTLFMVGFSVYGPQFLVGVLTADQSGKEATATAIGLTGFFGYVSTVASGVGLGALVDKGGWDLGFQGLIGCALMGAVPFALCWNTKPIQHPK